MDNIYANEEYYFNEYLAGKDSTIPSGSFSYYARKASRQIDRYTYGRLQTVWEVTDDVKECCCEIAEYLYSCDQQEIRTGGLVSYSNDGESGTFDTASYTKKEKNAKVRSAIRNYLADTGLLYQGRYPEERHES